MTSGTFQKLIDARELLVEARRYVRSKPREASNNIDKFRDIVVLIAWNDSLLSSNDAAILQRIWRNLGIVHRDILAGPSMATGYIDGAMWELAGLICQGEKEIENGVQQNR